MKILLVEDDGYKQKRIEAVLRECVTDISLEVSKSVREAVTQLQGTVFQHIILDIALPSRDNVAGDGAALPMTSGGLEVLLELSYQTRADMVTILTQYPEIELDGRHVGLDSARSALQATMDVNIIDVIYFQMDDSDWERKLVKAVNTNA